MSKIRLKLPEDVKFFTPRDFSRRLLSAPMLTTSATSALSANWIKVSVWQMTFDENEIKTWWWIEFAAIMTPATRHTFARNARFFLNKFKGGKTTRSRNGPLLKMTNVFASRKDEKSGEKISKTSRKGLRLLCRWSESSSNGVLEKSDMMLKLWDLMRSRVEFWQNTRKMWKNILILVQMLFCYVFSNEVESTSFAETKINFSRNWIMTLL